MKTVVIFLIFALAFQQVLSTHEEDYTNRGLKDAFSKIIKGIISLIEKTMLAILAEVTKGIVNIQDIVNVGIELVQKTINGILDAINDLEKKALDLGVDVAECVVDNKKLIKDLGDKTLDKLKKNKNRIISTINTIKDEAVKTIQGYTDVVLTLLDDFRKCSIINLVCMSKVIVKATKTSIGITVELPLVAAKVIKTIGQTIIGGIADITSITKDFTTTSAALMLKVSVCVYEKIPNAY